MANELASLYRAENSEDLSKSSITFGDPNPRAIYSGLYETIPWPSTIPLPEKVGFKWNYRSRTLRGCCRVSIRVIELSFIYQHPALSQELVHIIAHEMAHFIWGGHHLEPVDLNGDGTRQYLVRDEGRCGSGGCAEALFMRVGNGWKKLLDNFGSLQVMNKRTKGFADVVVSYSVYNPNKHTVQKTYQWDGQQYRTRK